MMAINGPRAHAALAWHAAPGHVALPRGACVAHHGAQHVALQVHVNHTGLPARAPSPPDPGPPRVALRATRGERNFRVR